MSLIQDVFLETDWEEAGQARAARDQRVAQLQAQGLTCVCTTLYRITDGRQVFLVEAQPPEVDEETGSSSRPRRSKPRERQPQKVEYR